MPGRFYVEKQGAVTAALSDLGLSRLTFRFEQKGSQIIEDRLIGPFIEKQPPQIMNRNPPIEVNSLR